MDRLQEDRHDTTLMADRMPGNIRCRGKHHQIPQEHNANRKAILTSSGTRLAEVNIRRDLPRRLSPLLFIVAMIPMTRVLERMEGRYQLKKGGSRINHLMFMDDIKLFGRGTKEIDTLVQTKELSQVTSEWSLE